MRRYASSTPYWITARFISECSTCHRKVTKGERIFYYPSTKTALCSKDSCGMQAQRDLDANTFDEQNCVW